LVTGGAGFIGISLVEALIDKGDEVTILDNFSSSNPSSTSPIRRHKLVKIVRGDCRSRQDLRQSLKEVETVFHLAANPEVRNVDPEVSFRDNVESTKGVLEALSRSSAEKIVFTSSSTVYGDAEVLPTPEDYRPLMPISVYGATKLISEVLVSDYSASFGFRSAVLRLANIVGPRSNHGVIPDFIRKLKRTPHTLKVLGDGSQSKSFLHIEDCVAASLSRRRRPSMGRPTTWARRTL
jgi:UDP-glucose 4-epimerase